MNFEVIADNWRYILFGTYPDGPLEGAALTLLISLLAGSISIILGIFIGILLTILRSVWVNLLAVFLCFLKSIPVILLIFWSYFLLPTLLGTDIPELITVIVVLSLISAAYLAYVVKAGIAAISQGQWQAGMSLGFTMFEVLWNIILPQVLLMMVPSFINQLIALIKDTSLAYIVGLAELSFLAAQVNNREMIYSMEIFLFVAFIYFVMCFSLEIIANYILRNFKKNRFFLDVLSVQLN
ncbi:amino acid ABC transporter permease [Arsenophonus symbiont of Ornithomya chloropus]|uniref:amino acid ABC transporter permease n=1 Tax=Arsenophonus symbiont of Ornithomya chloropus TaxID=634121 RepID=UPI0032B29AE1